MERKRMSIIGLWFEIWSNFGQKNVLPEKIRNTFSDGLIKKGSKLKIEIYVLQNPVGNSNKYLSPTYIANLVIKYWGIYKCNLNPF